MNECLKCGKELSHIEGRRKKQFCNETCRSLYWYYKNKPKAKKKSEPPVQVINLNQPQNQTNYTINTNKDDILAEIKELEDKIRLVPNGQYYNKIVKSFRDKINELQNKLKQ
jgi:hypothetical protein